MLLDPQELSELILLIQQQFGIDLSDYAKSSLQRRFQHLSVLNGLSNSSQLFDFIQKQTSKNSLVEKITVSTTELFRDPGFWLVLKDDVLKKLAVKKEISVWHLACSSGEEVISMNILLQESGLHHKTSVLGSDISYHQLQRAEKAVFPERKLQPYKNSYSKLFKEGDFGAYFEIDENKLFRFKSKFLKQTSYSVFDLVQDHSTAKFDLILCRNVMIYFNAELQSRVLQKLCDCLHPGGFLALGHNESILKSHPQNRLVPYHPTENIYRVY